MDLFIETELLYFWHFNN